MRSKAEQDLTKSPFVILMNKVTQSEKETFELGEKFAENLNTGDVVALFGELGSGKTRMIQGICSGLGVQELVSSPTFTLINQYYGRVTVYHFDFYRLSSIEEVRNIGSEEYFYNNGVSLIEWADRIADLLPPKRYEIILDHVFDENSQNIRKIQIYHIDNNLAE